MDKTINVGHPFYFPTQVVLVDDDPDFLEGISLMLNRDLSYRLYQSAHDALGYVNQAHQHVGFLQRCYASYKTGPQASDALSHIDIEKLHREVLNGGRFQTCSSVIVDYSMPEMNGLEFLMSLKNPYIKKVLLTGQADTELAVKAFNKQLIDQFIDKHDPRLKHKLNNAIATFQDQYFRTSFKLLTDPIIANNHDAFLVDDDFQRFFADTRDRLDTVEYYMIDAPQPGFLLVSYTGECTCMLVLTPEAVEEHCQQLEQLGAPRTLRDKVRAGDLLPAFATQDEELPAGDPRVENWPRHYYPATRLSGARDYYITLVSDELLPGINKQSIIPYANFLQSNFGLDTVIH